MKPALIHSFLCGLGLSCALTVSAQKQKPNIIHIISDDVAWDDLSCFGSKDIRTPNLDRMAQEGMRFTSFYAPHSTSTPSRVALLTGRFAPRINEGKGLDVLFPHDTTGVDPEKEVSLASLLKKEGYHTAVIGKWHTGHQKRYLPLAHGFDYYFGIPYPNDMGAERRFGLTNIYRKLPPVPLFRNNEKIKECNKYDLAELPHWFLREAIDYIAERAQKGEPFYLHWSIIETHTPWLVPLGFEGKSQAGAYGDAVEYNDYCIGILLEALKRLKLDENTLVVYSSDNGQITKNSIDLEMAFGKYATLDTTRTHILREGKGQARYEGGCRVPCIMRWPGVISQGQENNFIVTGADLFTTFVHLAGAEIPQDRVMDGKDVLPIIKGNRKSVHEAFYGWTSNGTLMSVTKGKWKLAVPSKKTWSIAALDEAQLFDLEKDIHERNDISKEHPNIVKELTALAEEAKKAMKEGKKLPLH
ncbi:MAG: sulfatase-like hydrolase/transferase [Bacteroidales bacterium]|nr:sulfatase-like hydrolase/transferase [Bacteroidales bacterium]